jgi:hypothetical protein
MKASEDDLAWIDPGTDPFVTARALLAENAGLVGVLASHARELPATTRSETLTRWSRAPAPSDATSITDAGLSALLNHGGSN